MLYLIKVCMNCFKICLTKKEKPVVGAGVAKRREGGSATMFLTTSPIRHFVQIVYFILLNTMVDTVLRDVSVCFLNFFIAKRSLTCPASSWQQPRIFLSTHSQQGHRSRPEHKESTISTAVDFYEGRPNPRSRLL